MFLDLPKSPHRADLQDQKLQKAFTSPHLQHVGLCIRVPHHRHHHAPAPVRLSLQPHGQHSCSTQSITAQHSAAQQPYQSSSQSQYPSLLLLPVRYPTHCLIRHCHYTPCHETLSLGLCVPRTAPPPITSPQSPTHCSIHHCHNSSRPEIPFPDLLASPIPSPPRLLQ